jgi:hypothetical protein
MCQNHPFYFDVFCLFVRSGVRMRLTPDVLGKSEVSLNPNHEVELNLRGQSSLSPSLREKSECSVFVVF